VKRTVTEACEVPGPGSAEIRVMSQLTGKSEDDLCQPNGLMVARSWC
jgi:hypothetical protein